MEQANKNLPEEIESFDDLDLLPELKEKVQDLKLSVRTSNCFKMENIVFISDLVTKTEADLLKYPNFGRTSLIEVKELLELRGLKLGMSLGACYSSYQEKKEIIPLDEIVDQRIGYLLRHSKNIPSGWIEIVCSANPDLKLKLEGIEANSDTVYLIRREKLEPSVLKEVDERRFNILLEDESLDKLDPFIILSICPLWLLKMDIKYFYSGSVRLDNVIRNENLSCLLDIAKYSSAELLRIPNMGKKSLRDLARSLVECSKKGAPPSLDSENSKLEPLIDAFNRTMSKVKDSKHATIMQARLGLDGKPKTLEELGKVMGVTRERVRQIQKKLTKQFLDSEYWDDIMFMKINNLMNHRNTPLFLDRISTEDSWFAGFEDNLQLLENVISAFSKIENLNFITIQGRRVIARIDQAQWRDLKYEIIGHIEHSLDLRYLIEDVELLIDAKAQEISCPELSSLMSEDIFKDLNFTSFDGQVVVVSVGNSLSSHLKAILETVPAPVHFEELTKLYEERYQLRTPSSRYIHSCLSNGDFLIFGRGTYGVQRHLQIDSGTQSSIIEMVEQAVIKEDASKQWHSNTFIDIISKAFPHIEVNIYILNMILKNSKVLKYLGKSTWKIKTQGDESTERLHIRQAIYEALLKAGKPLHVDDLYDAVSSIRGIGQFFNIQPNELFSKMDSSTWGLIDRDFILDDAGWNEVKAYLFEKLSEQKKALHKSELMQCLSDLSLPDNITENHVNGILLTDSRFKTWSGSLIGLSSWNGAGRASFTEAVKQVANQISDNAEMDEIASKVEQILGYKFNKNRIGLYLNEIGFSFDRDANLWKRKAS